MNRALRARRRSAPLTFGILAILVALGGLIATAKAQNLSAESDAFDAFADDVAFHTEEVTELTVDLLETGVETEIFVLERTRQLARAGTLARSANVFGAVADGLMEAPEIYLAAKQHGAKGLARETVGAGIQVGLGLATGFACGHAAAFATGVVLATGVGAPAAPVVYAFGFFVCQYAGGKVADKIEDRVEGGLGKILGIPDGRNGRARNSRASTVAGRANRPPRGAGVRVGNVDINTATGDVTTTATGPNARAQTDVGVARGSDGGDVRITARTGNVTTTASGRNSSASSEVGVANGAGTISVRTGDVSTSARAGETATTEVGTVSGGGRVTVRTQDVVTGGNAETVVGSTHGGRVGVSTGDVVTTGRRGQATTSIGAGGNARTGDVINSGGNLRIGGGACVGYRDGKCCLKFHRSYCAISIIPSDKGRCPPRYELWGGLCYLYSDKRHRVQR